MALTPARITPPFTNTMARSTTPLYSSPSVKFTLVSLTIPSTSGEGCAPSSISSDAKDKPYAIWHNQHNRPSEASGVPLAHGQKEYSGPERGPFTKRFCWQVLFLPHTLQQTRSNVTSRFGSIKAIVCVPWVNLEILLTVNLDEELAFDCLSTSFGLSGASTAGLIRASFCNIAIKPSGANAMGGTSRAQHTYLNAKRFGARRINRRFWTRTRHVSAFAWS